MYLSVFLPLNCNIRQLVGWFSFLKRKLEVFKDYRASDRRKLDMFKEGDRPPETPWNKFGGIRGVPGVVLGN